MRLLANGMLVCIDENGPSEWFYEPEKAAYRRKFKNGDERFIKGEFLPDPYTLWENRQSVMKKADPSLSMDNLKAATKPQNATFKLWQHWQGVSH